MAEEKKKGTPSNDEGTEEEPMEGIEGEGEKTVIGGEEKEEGDIY